MKKYGRMLLASNNILVDIFRFLIDFICPMRCPFCDKFIPWNELLCDDCKELIGAEISEEICERCGKGICFCEQEGENLIYDGCIAISEYVDGSNIKDAVLKLKDNASFEAVEYFAWQLTERLSQIKELSDCTLITFVPMNSRKKRARGGNQSELLARAISRQTRIPFEPHLLKRAFSTVAQHELSAKERKEGAFHQYYLYSDEINLDGQRILICDDIITTGSTLNACAALLKKAGAKEVFGLAIASTNNQKVV